MLPGIVDEGWAKLQRSFQVHDLTIAWSAGPRNQELSSLLGHNKLTFDSKMLERHLCRLRHYLSEIPTIPESEVFPGLRPMILSIYDRELAATLSMLPSVFNDLISPASIVGVNE